MNRVSKFKRKLENAVFAELDYEKRLEVVRQALIVVTDFFVHLPQKESGRAIRPEQELILLRAELEAHRPPKKKDRAHASRAESPAAQSMTDKQFHARMVEIFSHLKDNHTRYSATKGEKEYFATLPFWIEKYENSRSHYIVTGVSDNLCESLIPIPRTKAQIDAIKEIFQPGLEITHWNGVEIERAIEMNGRQFWGANQAALVAQGLRFLTQRPLASATGPLEDTVTIGQKRSGDEAPSKTWTFVWSFEPAPMNLRSLDNSLGLDLVSKGIGQWRKRTVLAREAERSAGKKVTHRPVAPASRTVRMTPLAQDSEDMAFTAQVLEVGDGRKYGYFRIWHFDVLDPERSPADFVQEFRAALESLEPHYPAGLILDIRDNPGGEVEVADLLISTLMEGDAPPTVFQFRATRGTVELTRKAGDLLKPWARSIEAAARTGSGYSDARPITRVVPRGRRSLNYPIVLVTNATCYSAADLFAARFQDFGVGKIVGVDPTTGAGGANFWEHKSLVLHFWDHSVEEDLPDPDSPDMFEKVTKLLTDKGYEVLPRDPLQDDQQWIVKRGDQLFWAIFKPKLLGNALRLYEISGDPGPRWNEDLVYHGFLKPRPNGLAPLPRGIGLDFSVRRALRQREWEGTLVEDLGVMADQTFKLTRRDLLDKNCDLLLKVVDYLRRQPQPLDSASVEQKGASGNVDGRPRMDGRPDVQAHAPRSPRNELLSAPPRGRARA